jgi:hypothetical protein
VAEWWMLAAARRGWILTRGSSFGLSAAARGSLLTAAYPHPFCRDEMTMDAPLSPPLSTPLSPHPGPVYTVHEHKVRQLLASFHLLFSCLCMPFCYLVFVCGSASGKGLGVWCLAWHFAGSCTCAGAARNRLPNIRNLCPPPSSCVFATRLKPEHAAAASATSRVGFRPNVPSEAK